MEQTVKVGPYDVVLQLNDSGGVTGFTIKNFRPFDPFNDFSLTVAPAQSVQYVEDLIAYIIANPPT